jgi:dephospho-CoA kinase
MSTSTRTPAHKTLIVLTGPMAAGKGALEEWAQDKHIPFISMSEIIEEHAGKPKEELGREGMQDFANTQRQIEGADLYAREVGKRVDMTDSSLVIIDGMRNSHECEYFQAHYETLVVGVVPPSPDKEFENIKRRARPGDPQTREQFEQLRQRELGDAEGEAGQQVAACLAMADALIVNEGGEEHRQELVERFEAILRDWGIAPDR